MTGGFVAYSHEPFWGTFTLSWGWEDREVEYRDVDGSLVVCRHSNSALASKNNGQDKQHGPKLTILFLFQSLQFG